MSEEEVVTENEQTSEEVDNSKAVAEMIERPENVPEKFWNDETKSVNNDAVLESYNHLSKKFGAFTGAPEEYEFSLSDQLVEKGVELDKENPLIASFTEMAKEANMDAKMANTLVNMYVESQYADSLSFEDSEAERVQEEMKKLGDNADQRISNIANWAKANLNPEHVDGLAEVATTASGVQAIEALIARTKNSSVQATEAESAGVIDMQELHKLQFARDENGNRKMQVDPAYRKMVQDKYAQALPGENIHTIG